MRSPSSWVSRTRLASSSSAPFIHGGTAGRMSTSSSIGTGIALAGEGAVDLGVDRARRGLALRDACRRSPYGSTSSNDSGPAPRTRGFPSAPTGSWTGPGAKMVNTRPSAKATLAWTSWVSHWSATASIADAGQAELDAVVPDPGVHRLAHLRIVRLLGEDVLELVAQPAREIDRHDPLATSSATSTAADGVRPAIVTPELDEVDFFADDAVVEDPVPVLRAPAVEVPGDADPAARRRRGHGLGRGLRHLPRHRHLLVVQLRRRAVRRLPGAARRRRRERHHRRPPAPAADERAPRHHGPAGAHARAGAADAPHHAQAAQAERGVHVASRRSAARRVRRRRPLRVHQRLLAAVRHARGRRPARRARVRPPAVPGGLRPARHDARVVRRTRTSSNGSSTPSGGSTSGSPPTSRTAAASRAPTSSPISPRPSTPTARRPMSPRSCGSRRSCSPRARRRPRGSSPTALKYLAEYPELQDELREHRDRIPNFIEEALRIESPVKADFRLARRATTVGDVRHRTGHAGDAAQRCGQPRSSTLRVPGRVPRRSPERHGPHRVRAGRPLVPRRTAGARRGAHQHRAHPRTARATSGCPRSTTGPPATVGSRTSRPGCCAA